MFEETNLIGLKTLYFKEVRRFIKVYNQTLITPVVTALLFLAIFNLAINSNNHLIGDVPFAKFMAAGLIMMSVMQQSFANTSSSFIMGKVLGNIIDYLMPPLSAAEITFGMVMAGVTRGVIVGALCGVSIMFFVHLQIHDFLAMIFYMVSASMLLAILGLFAGIIAETFDQMAAVTSYVITPLSFLSGTFYSVADLPKFWYFISHLNPFFYMIDGFRYSVTGFHDGSLLIGAVYITITNIVMWCVVQTMIKKGYRIKS